MSASFNEWPADILANAIDRAFADVQDATVADMMNAARTCGAIVPPSSDIGTLDSELRRWITARGLKKISRQFSIMQDTARSASEFSDRG
jgi:hypothetical protein